MRRSTPGQIEKACQELFHDTSATVMPRLIAEVKVPQRVAAKLDVTSTAVRNWLLSHGWHYDEAISEWVAPVLETEHA